MEKDQNSTRKTPLPEGEDREPAWHCDTYCRKIRHVYCEGMEHVKEGAPDLCPYFDEMLY